MEGSKWDTRERFSRSTDGSRRTLQGASPSRRFPFARPSGWSTPCFILRPRPGAGMGPTATSRVSRRNCPKRSVPKSRSSRAKKGRGNWSSAIRATITWTTSSPGSAANDLRPDGWPTRKREIHGRAPPVAPRRCFPHPLLDLLRPGDLREGAGAHFLRSELELRGARGGAAAPGRFQADLHRRKARRRGARRGRLDQRCRESLRPPGRTVLSEASRHRRGVHVSLPSVDL